MFPVAAMLASFRTPRISAAYTMTHGITMPIPLTAMLALVLLTR